MVKKQREEEIKPSTDTYKKINEMVSIFSSNKRFLKKIKSVDGDYY